MAASFSSNIREIQAELKLMDKKFAAGVRKAIRVAVAEASAATTAAIKAKASDEGLQKASQGTSVKVSFALRSAGAKITTSQKVARYARPLEQGSKGGGGGINRHPVFGRPVFVNQPTRPFFFKTAQAEEPLSEEKLNVAVNVAIAEAGFYGF